MHSEWQIRRWRGRERKRERKRETKERERRYSNTNRLSRSIAPLPSSSHAWFYFLSTTPTDPNRSSEVGSDFRPWNLKNPNNTKSVPTWCITWKTSLGRHIDFWGKGGGWEGGGHFCPKIEWWCITGTNFVQPDLNGMTEGRLPRVHKASKK